jgi:hypothetical protein
MVEPRLAVMDSAACNPPSSAIGIEIPIRSAPPFEISEIRE